MLDSARWEQFPWKSQVFEDLEVLFQPDEGSSDEQWQIGTAGAACSLAQGRSSWDLLCFA
jgi:hypothetical protein